MPLGAGAGRNRSRRTAGGGIGDARAVAIEGLGVCSGRGGVAVSRGSGMGSGDGVATIANVAREATIVSVAMLLRHFTDFPIVEGQDWQAHLTGFPAGRENDLAYECNS
jgi:hypothetical protein